MEMDPWTPGPLGSIKVIIKYGKGYEESWATFDAPSSADLRQQITDYFGIDSATVADLTLSELVVNVTAIAHGKATVAKALDAVVIGSHPTEAPKTQAEVAVENPWAGISETSKPQPPAPEVNPLFAQIKGCTGPDQLRELWAKNQAAFADPEIMAAWKARGKALSEAA